MKEKLIKKGVAKVVKTKEVNHVEVDTKKFSSFLSKIYLGGRLNECVVKSEGQSSFVSSIDPSNIVFISVQENIDLSPLGDIGLGDIQILSKFVSDCPAETIKLTKKENRIVAAHPSGMELQYLLTDPTLITTSVEGGKIAEIIENCDYAFKLTKEVKDAFLYMTNLLKAKTASVIVEKNKVFLTGGLTNEHNSKIEAGTLEDIGSDITFEEEFVCSFYADYIRDVFSVLEFKEGEEPVIIFSPEYPMVVQEGENNWAIFPLTLD